MRYLSALLIVGFIGMAVFGVFGMHFGMQNHDGGCIGATAQGVDCPKLINPLDYLTFHLDAYKGFTTATFGENQLMLLFALALLAVWVSLAKSFGNPVPPLILAYSRRFSGEPFNLSVKRDFIRWIALHENSPSFF